MKRKIFKIGTVLLITFWAVGLAGIVPMAQATTLTSGDLIKASLPTVYYFGADGKRYVFPNEATYKSWYPDFSNIKILTDAELAGLNIGGNVTIRPGVKLVKITTDPRVYAVGQGGILRWISSEIIAMALYGANWKSLIVDTADAFFVNYNVGAPINSTADYNPQAATAAATSINTDKLLAVPSPGVLNLALAADTPQAGVLAAGATADFTKIILSASGVDISVKSIYVMRFGISSNGDVSNIKFINASGQQLGNSADLNSDSRALITFNPFLTVSQNNPVSLLIRASVAASFSSGKTISLGINQASDIELVSGSVAGNFYVRGNSMGFNPIFTDITGLTPPEGILIGNKAKQGVASFKVTAGQAEDMNLNSITITDLGTGKVATNWYLYSNKRNDGGSIYEPAASSILDPITKKTKFILSANTITVPASQNVTLTIAVDAAAIDGVTVKNGDTLKAVVAAGTDIIATGKASGQQINGSASTDSKIYYTLASYPYFSVDALSPKQTLVPGAKTLLAIFDITADAAKEVDFLSAANNTTGIANKLTVNIAHSCTVGVGNGMVLQDDSGNVLDTQAVDICASNSVTFTFGNPGNLQIGPGATKKLYIYADTSGANNNGNSIQLYLDDSNAANLDFAIDGSGNYKFAQYIFAGGIYSNALAR